jgi:hypothetical protein
VTGRVVLAVIGLWALLICVVGPILGWLFRRQQPPKGGKK